MIKTDLTGGLPAEREYFYAEKPDKPEIRDAINTWIEDENGRFGMRIGVEANSTDWETPEIYLDIAFPNGRVISHRSRGQIHEAIDGNGKPSIRGAGPLRFQCVEPFKLWTVDFKGEAAVIAAEDLIATPYPEEKEFCEVDFSIEMIMAVPPWIMGSLVADAGEALENSDQGDYMSPRYEQLFRCKGNVRIGEEAFKFKGQGLRIKRQGFRKFEGFWGHCWQSALFPSGKAFGFNVFPPRDDGQPSYSEGYVFDGEGELRPALPTKIPWLEELVVSGDTAACELESPKGKAGVDGTVFINTRARYSTQLPPDFPPDFPVIQQSHVAYRWGNEETTGMMERSTAPSKMRAYRDWRD